METKGWMDKKYCRRKKKLENKGRWKQRMRRNKDGRKKKKRWRDKEAEELIKKNSV